MAKEDRAEIAWATFNSDVRLASDSSRSRAVVRTDAVRLYLGTVLGQPFLVVEDSALPHPVTVPWHSVASIGWVSPPAIDATKVPK